ncbi:sensor histidine kinase [Paenibacillus sp. GSMTC-2017]|uniref:sensor histidine kinase n=1 Tax=Paenibacillus sp. GSMTC-2017 TaxID=2794350 RepID=UPI0018D60BA5|nr:histidine kinase [Paenibacillus sp. GSMTC-2017]MBH5318936.1 sensor histidine kinase [Paenibacillus sp. GSMTC-2017]
MLGLRFNSFHARLLLWILLSTLVLLIGLTGVFYHYTAGQIDLRVGEAAQRNVSQAMDNFSLMSRGYDSLGKSIMSNSEIQRLLSREAANEQDEFDKQLQMMAALGTIFYSYNDVKGIHIISNAGNVYSYESTTHGINDKFMKGDWLSELRRSDGTLEWGGMLGDQSLTIREDSVFTFGRLMSNLYTTRPLGVLIIEADPRTVLSSMNNLMIKPESRTYIFAASGTLLVSSHPEEKVESSWLIDHSQYPFGESVLNVSTSNHLILTANDSKLGWKLLSITPKPVAKVEQAAANRYFIIVTIIIIMVAIAIAYFLSRSVSKPIKSIVQEVRRVERGDLSTNLHASDSYEEINYLNEHFNRMVNEINGLVERNKIATASEKNAQIHALQSQVNPHFLYNTLDMIYWLLDEKENERLSNLILSLSCMFRYSSDWRSSVATLGDELEQIKHYMTIISARSDGRIHVNHHIDNKSLMVSLPKMTLQPLIENAVIHGLSGRTGEGAITLTSTEEGQKVFIYIHDNGVGISEEKLVELKNSLARAERLEWNELLEEERQSMTVEPAIYGTSHGSGAGFLNVHRRLVLEFGAGYGLRVESKENNGTTIIVMVPNVMPRV